MHRSSPATRRVRTVGSAPPRIWVFALFLLAIAGFAPARVAAAATVSAPGTNGSLPLYDDALAPGWTSCAWNASVDFAATAQVYSGHQSVALTVTAPGGGLCLSTPQPVDATPYASLRFAARAAQGGGRYQVFLYDQNMQPFGYRWLASASGDPTASSWTVYSLPLTQLQAAGRSVRGFGIQPIDGNAPETLYLDDIALVATGGDSLSVYGDALAPGWINCSWNAAVDFGSAAQAHAGSRAIGVTTTAAGGGLCLTTASAIDTTPFAALSFAARAAQPGGRYQVFLYDRNMQPLGYVGLGSVGGEPPADAWAVYTVPLTALGAAAQQVRGLAVQAIDGPAPATFSVDEIAFVTALAAVSAAPAPGPDGNLTVYADSLASGWSSCAWDAAVDFRASATVYGGSRAISTTITAPGGGLCLTAAQAFDSTPYASLRFAARAAQNGGRYQVYLYDKNMQPLIYVGLGNAGGDPTASGWTAYTLPLAALGGARRPIKGLAIQAIGGGAAATLYVDDISFLKGAAGAPPAPAPVALGAYIHGAPGDPAALDDFSAAVGSTPKVVMWYQDWGSAGSQDFDPQAMNAVVARGAMPMVTWQPWGPPYQPNSQPAWALARIAAGDYDAYAHQWARAAAAWGKPMYLRFAHEMNGDWNTWSPGVNGNTSADYVAAWRHVHDIFLQEGATSVRWVWSPNVLAPGDLRVLAMYPGDAYVDWIALDGYNWGTAAPGKAWQDFAGVFGYSYDVLTAAIGKPIMLAEVASAEAGGDKAGWITQGLLTDLPASMPAVRALIWFDENKETDWRVDSSTAALAAFRRAAASAAFRGVLP